VEDVTRSRRRAIAGTLAAIWAAAIWTASSLRPARLPALGAGGLDKVLHAATFLILSWLLAAALDPARARRAPRAFALAAAVLYGVLDEVHQSFVPGRMPAVGDALADAAGALLGVLLFSAARGSHRSDPPSRAGQDAEDPAVGLRGSGRGGDR
jgi:hypothetical protein